MKKGVVSVLLVPLFFVAMSCDKKDRNHICIVWQDTDNPQMTYYEVAAFGEQVSMNNEKHIKDKRYIEVWSNDTKCPDKKLFHAYFRGEMNDKSETMDIHIFSERDFELSFSFLNEDINIRIVDLLSGAASQPPVICKSGNYHFTAVQCNKE